MFSWIDLCVIRYYYSSSISFHAGFNPCFLGSTSACAPARQVQRTSNRLSIPAPWDLTLKLLFDYALSPHVKLDLPSFDFLELLASELLGSFGVLVVYVYLKYFTVSDTRSDLFDCFSSLLGEVSHQALQYGPGDVLFEPCFVHGWAVDPVVAALSHLLFSRARITKDINN